MIIKIDTKVWCTQKEYAKLTGKSLQAVSMLVARERLDTWQIAALGNIKLIKRPEHQPKN